MARKPAKRYEDILLPKNSGLSVVIAMFAGAIGFGMIWHLYWLSVLALFALVTTLIVRASNPEPEYIMTAKEVEKLEHAIVRRQKELAA